MVEGILRWLATLATVVGVLAFVWAAGRSYGHSEREDQRALVQDLLREIYAYKTHARDLYSRLAQARADRDRWRAAAFAADDAHSPQPVPFDEPEWDWPDDLA